jgi:protein phosphatase-4 regulatory subunit 3
MVSHLNFSLFAQLASFRLYRTFLKLNNRNLFAHLMKHDLLKPILDLTLLESRRDNLLSSSCQEFFDHMRRVKLLQLSPTAFLTWVSQENFKDLIKHCMTKHESLIRKLAETPLGGPRFESFINRWEMNNEPLPPEEPKAEKYVLIGVFLFASVLT